MSSKLFQEAIAQAKAIREVAMENAKQLLEESVTPHIKQMLAAKLEEMETAEDDEPIEEATDAGYTKVKEPKRAVKEAEEETTEDDPEETGDEGEESESDPESEEGSEEAPEGEDEPEEDDTIPGEEGEEDDRDLSALSVEEFKDIIRDIVNQEMSAPSEEELGAEMDGGDVEGMGEEEPEMEMGAEDEFTSGEEGSEDMPEDQPDDEEIDLNELLDSITGDSEKPTQPEKKVVVTQESKELAKVRKELQEAVKTIEHLTATLQETDLLNSKLLYLNKILDRNSLTESQKVKVITAFDKASTVKEAKLVYETLVESFSKGKSKSVQMVRENRGFASKGTGNVLKKPEILAEDVTKKRWQQLAGIIPEED